jgi:hypothetical protein
MFLYLDTEGPHREDACFMTEICRQRAHQILFTLFQRILRHRLWNREARSSRKAKGRAVGAVTLKQ